MKTFTLAFFFLFIIFPIKADTLYFCGNEIWENVVVHEIKCVPNKADVKISLTPKSSAEHFPKLLQNGWVSGVERIVISPKKQSQSKEPEQVKPKPEKIPKSPQSSKAPTDLKKINLDKVYKDIGVPNIKKKGATDLQRDKVIEDAHSLFEQKYKGMPVIVEIKIRDVSNVPFGTDYEISGSCIDTNHYVDIQFPASKKDNLVNIQKGDRIKISGTFNQIEPNFLDRSIITFKLINGKLQGK